MDLDLGILIIRLALGPMLLMHAYNKVFGAGGLAGTSRWFESLGLRPARLHAAGAAATEAAAAVLVTLGFLTPVACAAFVGLMVTAALTDHRGKGYFVFKGGSEYVLLVAMVAVALAALGPGAWSLDHATGIELSGAPWALFAVVLGGVAAAGLLAACFRPATPPV
jgi:putative oxidoreductase